MTTGIGKQIGTVDAARELIKSLASGDIKPDKISCERNYVRFETILGRVNITLSPDTVEGLRESKKLSTF